MNLLYKGSHSVQLTFKYYIFVYRVLNLQWVYVTILIEHKYCVSGMILT